MLLIEADNLSHNRVVIRSMSFPSKLENKYGEHQTCGGGFPRFRG